MVFCKRLISLYSILFLWLAKSAVVFFALFLSILSVNAQSASNFFRAAGSPVNPKVDIIWYRYYDSEGLASYMKKIAIAHPQYARLQSIGKSTEGRDIWCIIITDFTKGDPMRKPGVYVQGNIHGNEIQGSEFSLYTAWYLTEMADEITFIKELLAGKVFYIVPTINPDARDKFMHSPCHQNSYRGLIHPGGPFSTTQKDASFHDLDGDGSITEMRFKNPYGIVRKGAKDSSFMRSWENMVALPLDSIDRTDGKERAKYPSHENYDITIEGGVEGEVPFPVVDGYDPDNYDLNRNWGWVREGEYPRRDSTFYRAFCYPETRAIRDFFFAHPNIVAAESLHNVGGEIYAGTNIYSTTLESEKNAGADAETVEQLAKYGERVLANYTYRKAINGGLPGREIDWMYGVRGVYAFIVELMTDNLYYHRKAGPDDRNLFIDELLFGDGVVPWHKAHDPVHGEVEVGGFQKNIGRLHPGFLMQEDAHRNMAFTIRLAHEAPLLSIKNITVVSKEKDIREITAVIENNRFCGTHSNIDLLYKLTRPDHIILETSGKVISAERIDIVTNGTSQGQKSKKAKKDNIEPSLIEIINIPGHSSVTVRWIVKGGEKNPSVIIDSEKGGLITASVK